MSKKLSVAIPTYNRLVYLKECLKSILNQTFQDFSIFVFDNASDEPVEKELKKFNDERIHFIGSNKNMGSAGNINRILSYPFQSKYLTIFHDDDLMHPRMLEVQTSFLDRNDDIGFLVSKFNRFPDKMIHRFRNIVDNKIKYIVYKNSYEFVRAIMLWLRFAFDSAMYRTEVIGNSRLNFERFSDKDDQVFLIEIAKKGSCAFIDAPLVNSRTHPDQDSKLLKENYEDATIEALLFYRKNLPELLNGSENKLFSKYSLKTLLGSYVNINGGPSDFIRFIKRCHQKKIIKYGDFEYIDLYGIVSLIGIVLKNKKIFNKTKSLKDFFS